MLYFEFIQTRPILKHEQKYDQFTKTEQNNTKMSGNDEADVNNQKSRKH